MNIIFDNPPLLALLVLLFPAAWLVLRGRQKRRRLLAGLQARPVPRRWSGVAVLLLTQLLLASLLITAAGPRRLLNAGEDGLTANFVFMVDVSRSMAARNACSTSTRLDRARLIMTRVVDHLPGARFGITAFAGLAFVLGEPAYERQYLMEVIHNGLFVEVIPFPGSDVGNALHVFLEKKTMDPDIFRAVDNIILFSDGDLSGENVTALDEAIPLLNAAGVAVTTVGMGSARGMPIPTLNQARECMPGQFERADGKEFYTHLVEAPLQYLAAETGGTYFHESSQDNLLQYLSLRMTRLEDVEPPRQSEDLGSIFLLTALLSLLGLVLLRYR